MPEGPAMDAILAHGLPAETPLLVAINKAPAAIFYDDTRSSQDTIGFPELGVSSIAAAPVRKTNGELAGAFLMHTLQPHSWTTAEAELFSVIASTLASLTARLVAEEEALIAREDALRAIGLAVERRDSETKGHTDRVVALAVRIAEHLDIDQEMLTEVRWGAYLHDIGKIGIPDRILHKPGSLTDGEWAIMRKHSEFGHEFARELGFLSDGTLDLILYHHEKWAGGGYPSNLTGNNIPLPARLFAICDVYDALVTKRAYKPAWSHEEAMREIIVQSGKHFDPQVAAAFREVMRQMYPHPNDATRPLQIK
jgi:putative nucleotidyltransferase with HDIG domain